MKKNYMRVMLCLFMCCALLSTCVTRPVSAVEIVATVGIATVGVAVATACAMQALGFMSASNSANFTSTVNSCASWLSNNSSLVVNGAVSLLGMTSSGNTVSYLPKSFVQSVWEWLFSSSTVRSNTSAFNSTYYDGPCYSYGEAMAYAANCPKAFTGYNTKGEYCVIVVGNSSRVVLDGTTLSIDGRYVNHSFYNGGDRWLISGSSITSYYSNASPLATSGQIVSNVDDTQIGLMQSPISSVGTEEETIQIEIAPIYIDWTKYGVPDPNDPGGDDPDNDGKFPMWLPTGIPSPGYDDSVITQNQQQAQSGVVSGDITFEPYEPDDPGSGGGGAGSGTDLSSVIQAIINVPTAIVSGIGDFISDFFGFNGNYEDYTVRLRDFFPFCIPFDLYDFITVLSADPEAPVFHWEIPVPQLGQTFELEVDLSAWDDIAVLFRNLELLAFIFGLAVMTREKFLRS